MATTESLHKFYNASLYPPQNFTTTLEIEDMKLQYQIETGYEFGKEPKGEKGWIRVIGALSSLKNQGVLGFDEFASGEKVKKIKISSFENVVAGNVPDFHRACNYLHDGDILVGAIKMSYNYFELSPGEVYHYDPNHPIINPSNNKPMSHAVMFVGYGGHEWEVSMKEALAEKEAQHPAHLVYQNSYGKLFGFRGGFGRVGVSSVKNLAVVTI